MFISKRTAFQDALLPLGRATQTRCSVRFGAAAPPPASGDPAQPEPSFFVTHPFPDALEKAPKSGLQKLAYAIKAQVFPKWVMTYKEQKLSELLDTLTANMEQKTLVFQSQEASHLLGDISTFNFGHFYLFKERQIARTYQEPIPKTVFKIGDNRFSLYGERIKKSFYMNNTHFGVYSLLGENDVTATPDQDKDYFEMTGKNGHLVLDRKQGVLTYTDKSLGITIESRNRYLTAKASKVFKRMVRYLRKAQKMPQAMSVDLQRELKDEEILRRAGKLELG